MNINKGLVSKIAIAIILLFTSYSVFWFFKTSSTKKYIVLLINSSEGKITAGDVSVGGFPFSQKIAVTDLKFGNEQSSDEGAGDDYKVNIKLVEAKSGLFSSNFELTNLEKVELQKGSSPVGSIIFNQKPQANLLLDKGRLSKFSYHDSGYKITDDSQNSLGEVDSSNIDLEITALDNGKLHHKLQANFQGIGGSDKMSPDNLDIFNNTQLGSLLTRVLNNSGILQALAANSTDNNISNINPSNYQAGQPGISMASPANSSTTTSTISMPPAPIADTAMLPKEQNNSNQNNANPISGQQNNIPTTTQVATTQVATTQVATTQVASNQIAGNSAGAPLVASKTTSTLPPLPTPINSVTDATNNMATPPMVNNSLSNQNNQTLNNNSAIDQNPLVVNNSGNVVIDSKPLKQNIAVAIEYTLAPNKPEGKADSVEEQLSNANYGYKLLSANIQNISLTTSDYRIAASGNFVNESEALYDITLRFEKASNIINYIKKFLASALANLNTGMVPQGIEANSSNNIPSSLNLAMNNTSQEAISPTLAPNSGINNQNGGNMPANPAATGAGAINPNLLSVSNNNPSPIAAPTEQKTPFSLDITNILMDLASKNTESKEDAAIFEVKKAAGAEVTVNGLTFAEIMNKYFTLPIAKAPSETKAAN